MVSLETPICDFGQPAPKFALRGVDGNTWTQDDCMGARGLLVMFICNHCPYVQAIRERLIRDVRELQALGVGCVAIMSNDSRDYPEDSFENMRRIADEFAFPFPYLFDEHQNVARAYGAVCTPDFFGYNAERKLQYRGRFDASRKETAPAEVRRDLFEAMKQVAATGVGPAEQIPSIGCSIKWRET
ncbi:thioredoxin family protein [Chromatium weissei]|nr:thioredoxin family protein [Chromatium weissei]